MLPAVTASCCIHVAWESGLSERPDSSKTCESSCVRIWISDTMSEVSRRLCLIWIVIILSFHSWQRSDTFKLCFTGWENAVKGLIIRQIFSRKFSFKQDSEKWNYSQVTSDLFNFHLSIFCFLSRLRLQGQHSKHRVPDLPFPRQLLSWERKVWDIWDTDAFPQQPRDLVSPEGPRFAQSFLLVGHAWNFLPDAWITPAVSVWHAGFTVNPSWMKLFTISPKKNPSEGIHFCQKMSGKNRTWHKCLLSGGTVLNKLKADEGLKHPC